MDTLKEVLRAMFYRYCIVFTLIMGVNLIGVLVYGKMAESFACSDLLWIEGIAALCALGELLFFWPGELSKRKLLLLHILHYVYINVVVFGVVLIKTKIDITNILIILVSIAVIYWINCISDYCKDKKDALKMNDLLEKINNNDE